VAQILIPTRGPDDWSAFLADPAHWRTGYSARSLAHCWEEAEGDFPTEVRSLLATSPIFASAQPLLAIPEHQVALPGSGRPSQTDLWVLARTDAGLASIAVEGKVSEPFGPTIEEWLSAPSSNKQIRLAGLNDLLSLRGAELHLRYQLLHRTASAVIEARRFLASHALMIIHSFSQSDEWFHDFGNFVVALGGMPKKDELIAIPGRSGPTLHLGWVRGAERFLRA
jgi:hypothetical protein